ncbi:MAG TPA: TetR/AcrR family transcriptional regulator [Acidimicrobiales bacterium]|jgi:AcrR family transcriptional regulator|nr:TetR/AcrR family transcriptional regulator [Acidimicrobiales bacterium]
MIETGTRDRILQAGVEAAAIHGIARLTVGDVAKRAGVSRPTLYKHFRSKEDLVAAAVAREADRMVEAVVVRDLPTDPRRALESGILAVLRVTREHPLLDRIIRTEPETLLPLILEDGGAVSLRVRSTIEAILVERFEPIDPVVLRRYADLITRLVISYAVNAPDDPPEVVAHIVAAVLVDGALSLVEPAPGAAPGTAPASALSSLSSASVSGEEN